MPQRVLALELDAHEIKAAVLETTFRDYRVAAFHREPFVSGNGSVADQLRAFLLRHQIVPTTVLSSLPGDMVTLRTMFLPFRDRKQLDATVPFELENQVPFGLDEVVVDYSVLHRDRAGSTVLAALVQRKDLEDHLGTLTAAGLDPKVIDLAPLATLNVLKLLTEALPETFVYIGGSIRRTTVAFFRNRQLIGLRTLVPLAPSADEAHAAASGNGQVMNAPEHPLGLIGEIRWTLLALNGAPLDNGLPCIVAGDGVHFDQLGEQLATELDLSVRRLDHAALRPVPPTMRSEVDSFISPLGLALREVAPNEAVGLNFRRGVFSYHRGQEELRQALWRTAALAGVVLVLMLTSTYVGYQQLTNRMSFVQGQIRNVFAQTLPDVRHISDERKQLQDEIDAAQRRLQVLAQVAPVGGVTAIDILRTIAAAVPETVKVDVDEYTMDTDSVRIKAKTESFEAVDTIKQQLLNTKYFADVQVKDVKAAPDGKVDFRVALALGKYGETAATAAPAGTP